MEMYESLSLAFLVLLEELQPIERAVFLLRDVFDFEYAEIAEFLGKSEVACRQAFSRAKKHLADGRPRFTPSPQTQREMLGNFLQAVQGGDMDGLMTMLADDVTLWADSAGKIRGAATRPVIGRDAVARFSASSLRFLPEGSSSEIAEVNGQPSLVIRTSGRVFSVIAIEIAGRQIRAVRVIANPEKLAHV